MRKIIIDCDTGTDDAIALMLAVLSKKFDILGVTCVAGNQLVEDTADNTLRVLDFVGSDVKVYKGANGPMYPEIQEKRREFVSEGPIFYTDDKGEIHHLHPRHLWLPETKRKPEDKDAVDFIIDTCLNSKEKITIVPTGPASNVGKAIKKNPDIIRNIEEIVFMGGSVNTGNITETAEANFFNDPDAIKIIIDSGVKCVTAALDATIMAAIDVEKSNKLLDSDNKYLKFFGEIIKWRADVEYHLGWADGINEPLHDPMAIVYMIDDSFIKCVRHQVSIDTGVNPESGSLIVDKGIGNDDFWIMEECDKEKYYDFITDMFSE
ncbi:MAG: nucleoside hydrolase [Erysipelotrichaceae bacterium]|nr:nucleoside hydrolase [Erysipelotrichaceae bacterium]